MEHFYVQYVKLLRSIIETDFMSFLFCFSQNQEGQKGQEEEEEKEEDEGDSEG